MGALGGEKRKGAGAKLGRSGPRRRLGPGLPGEAAEETQESNSEFLRDSLISCIWKEKEN